MAEKRSFNALEDAVRSGRAAVLPMWLSVGSEVWYWRECWCEDEICDPADCVTAECPINRGRRWWEEEVKQCARRHPMLMHETVYHIQADFTPNGVAWILNDKQAVYEFNLRAAYFRTREEAEKARPREIVPGG